MDRRWSWPGPSGFLDCSVPGWGREGGSGARARRGPGLGEGGTTAGRRARITSSARGLRLRSLLPLNSVSEIKRPPRGCLAVSNTVIGKAAVTARGGTAVTATGPARHPAICRVSLPKRGWARGSRGLARRIRQFCSSIWTSSRPSSVTKVVGRPVISTWSPLWHQRSVS